MRKKYLSLLLIISLAITVLVPIGNVQGSVVLDSVVDILFVADEEAQNTIVLVYVDPFGDIMISLTEAIEVYGFPYLRNLFKDELGINLFFHGWVTWNSDNAENDGGKLLTEAVSETGFYSGMTYNGYVMDILVAITGQGLMYLDGVLVGGVAHSWEDAVIVNYNFVQQILTLGLISWTQVTAHEISHLYGLEHCGHAWCIMNPTAINLGMATAWQSTCYDTMVANKDRYTRYDLPPETPSTPSGHTTVYRNVWYTYSTSTTDPEGDDVRYEFEFTGPIPTVSFTTGWYASGETGSITVEWWDCDPLGTYQIRVRAQDVPGQWSDWSSSLAVSLVGYHDVAVTDVTVSPTSVRVGERVDISVDAKNEGDYAEIFSLTVYYDDNIIATHTLGSPLNPGWSWSWGPYWITTGVPAGTYTIKVVASTVPGETDTADNTYVDGTVKILSPHGGGCPTLSVWDGTDYYEEGLLDIHNLEGIDLITNHTLVSTPERVDGAFLMRLTEHPQTHSYIDEVNLYATIENGTTIELPLIWARHTEHGNVLPQLLFSDEWKTDTLGAELNNGTSQSIDLKFAALSPHLEIVGFTFQIEGVNGHHKR